MNIYEIYNVLLAGKTVKLEFIDKGDLERFRVSLARYKSRQDYQLIAVGMIKEEEKQKMTFQVQGQLVPLPPFLVTIMFKDKSVMRQFKVIVEESEDISEVEANA